MPLILKVALPKLPYCVYVAKIKPKLCFVLFVFFDDMILYCKVRRATWVPVNLGAPQLFCQAFLSMPDQSTALFEHVSV